MLELKYHEVSRLVANFCGAPLLPQPNAQLPSSSPSQPNAPIALGRQPDHSLNGVGPSRFAGYPPQPHHPYRQAFPPLPPTYVNPAPPMPYNAPGAMDGRSGFGNTLPWTPTVLLTLSDCRRTYALGI